MVSESAGVIEWKLCAQLRRNPPGGPGAKGAHASSLKPLRRVGYWRKAGDQFFDLGEWEWFFWLGVLWFSGVGLEFPALEGVSLWRMVVVVGTGQGCSLQSTGNELLAIPSASVASNEEASRSGPLLSSCLTLGFRDFWKAIFIFSSCPHPDSVFKLVFLVGPQGSSLNWKWKSLSVVHSLRTMDWM